MNRRDFLKKSSQGGFLALASCSSGCLSTDKSPSDKPESRRGHQRLSVQRLKEWEKLRYGMFACFAMNTFDTKKYAPGQIPADLYAPHSLDVEQWISVARDAGMTYAVLTVQTETGFCLWPSNHSDYTVANSGNKTDVVERFVKACDKKGLMAGLYYCSMDNYHGYGSLTRDFAKRGFIPRFPRTQHEDLPPYTTSVYQTFMTAQITELLTRYGPVGEVWIDLPGELGRGYRTFLYHYIAELLPDAVIMMNNGVPDSTKYDVEYAWPSDLIAMERGLPPESGYQKWRIIEDKDYYVPGEVCDTLGEKWYHDVSDPPRSDKRLLGMYQACQKGGANLLLSVPPSKHGVITDDYIKVLMRLRKNTKI